MASSSSVSYRKAQTPSEFLDLLEVGSETYCRYLWSTAIKKEDGAWEAIGNRQSGKKVTTLAEFKLRAERYVPKRSAVNCTVDVFLSPNEFFDWRCVPQLAALRANWVEIDTNGHEAVSAEHESQILQEALSQIEAANLPAPTGWVFSGSGGVHLYWIYDQPVEAYRWRVNVWRAMAEKLSSLSGGNHWHVDCSASNDPARVLRLAGSIHGGTGRLVNAYVGGERVAFEALAAALGVSAERPASKVTLVKSEPKEGRGSPNHRPSVSENKTPRRHTIAQWWARVYFEVVSHARRMGVPEGRRDLTAFILYVALRHIKPEEQAFEDVMKLNEDFIKLDPEQLTGYLATARRIHYKFSKSTLARYLRKIGIEPDFLYAPSPVKLSPDQVKIKQQDAAAETAHKKRSRTLARIQAILPTLSRITQACIASTLGISERTVRRYWHEVKQVISSPSIYSPPLGGCPVL